MKADDLAKSLILIRLAIHRWQLITYVQYNSIIVSPPIDELCLNCGANANYSCDLCGLFCGDCLARRHKHPSRDNHTTKVNDNRTSLP